MSMLRTTRQELYEKVWTIPATKVAKGIGISDVGLGKICKRYNIPKPALGDWTRVAHGSRLERIPLPAAPPGIGEIIEIVSQEQKPSNTWAERYPAVYAEFGCIPSEAVHLEIIDSMSELHPLLKESLKYLKSATPDAYFRLTPGQSTCVDINVSKPMLERSLKFLHTLFRFLEAQGFVIQVQKEYRMSTKAIIREVEVEISLIEKVRRTPTSTAQTASEFSSVDRKFIYQPSGVLSFRIMNVYGEGTRKEWSDTENFKLEEEIVSVAEGILNAAVAIRIQDLERSERNRESDLQRVAEKEKQEQLQQEKARRERLLQDSADWQASENLRAYIEAVKIKRKKKNDSDTDLSEWVNWATCVADELDPIRL